MEPLLEGHTARPAAAAQRREYVGQAKVAMPDPLQMYNLPLRLGPQEVLTPHSARASTGHRPTTGAPRLPRATCRRCAQAPRWPAWRSASHSSTRICSTFRCACRQSTYSRACNCAGSSRKRCAASYPTRSSRRRRHRFGLPFGVRATRRAALKALAADSLAGFATRGVVRPEFMDRLVDQLLPCTSWLLRRTGVDPDDARAVAAPARAQVTHRLKPARGRTRLPNDAAAKSFAMSLLCAIRR